MTTISDTPETDELANAGILEGAYASVAAVDWAELCRKLERERNDALQRCNRLSRRLTKAEGIIAASGIAEDRPKTGSGGLGRALANYAAEQYRRERDRYRRAIELIAEDCEAWLKSESDEPSVDFIKLVAKYAREALQ